MNIYIKRIYTDLNKYTVGQLWIDGVFVCDTLEDPERNLPDVCPYTPKWKNCKCKEKVYADTAIPKGVYKSRISYSPRFKRELIELMNVMHFIGIRIHGGNHKGHTEGCILVGEYTRDGVLINSQENLSKLHIIVYGKLKESGLSKDKFIFNVIIE